MSRVSDTRLRTREAAANLVIAGRRPHDLTVDLIYAEIKQGSRTTINDELKLWKDEQAKSDALTAALPPVVANAMLNIWAVAVEHGEKVFGQRREEVETQLAQATARIESLESEKAQLTKMLSSERATKEATMARASALEQQLESAKTNSEQASSTRKAEHQQHVEKLQAALVAQEAAFRQEIDKATERLEGVQKHVLLQVSEARESQKRAEAQLSKANQKNEQLSTEVQQLRWQVASFTQMSERAQADLGQSHDEKNQLRAERESLIQQVAGATGKLGALGEQIESLERRAVGAETRLEEALKRPPTNKKKAEKPRQQDLIHR